MQYLYGWSNGSTDEANFEITGFEWMRLFRYVKNKFAYFCLLLFYLVDSSFRQLRVVIQGKLATVLVDSDFETPDDFVDSINYISTILLASIVAQFVADMIAAIMESFYMTRFVRDLRVEIMSKILEQDVSYFDQTQTGVILSRLSDDVSNACDALTDTISDFLYCIYDFLIGIVVSFVQSWQVTLIALCSFPIYGLSQCLGKHYINRLYLNYNDKSTKATAKAEEILTSFRTVKPFDSELREYHSYRDHLFEVHHVLLKTSIVRGIQRSVESLTQWGMTSFVLFYTGIQAVRGEIDAGSIVTIMSIIQSWSYSVSSSFSSFSDFRKANVSAAKLCQIIDRVPLVKVDEGNEINQRVKGTIEFRNVSFKYPTRDEYALKNLSFKVNQGETIALVGESGCGKSTTLQLIQRFYDVNEGQILIDGIDIKTVNPISLRTQISIVPQGPVIFSMNVKDNIRFGKPQAKRDDVVHSATIANAHNFILRLKDGYKTMITQTSLSGGQKQRICIARAVLLNAPVILLDEATAALDTESESLVQKSITQLKEEQHSTSIIVAHRLATVRNADRILVLEKGSIVEEGSHEELLQRSGAYAQLVQYQLL